VPKNDLDHSLTAIELALLLDLLAFLALAGFFVFFAFLPLAFLTDFFATRFAFAGAPSTNSSTAAFARIRSIGNC
jgi:hypothetical protein